MIEAALVFFGFTGFCILLVYGVLLYDRLAQ
jgi:hypothetical protein